MTTFLNLEFFAGLILGVVAVLAFVIALGGPDRVYKDGQIDCLNHEIYYQLTEQEDGTTQWEYVPEGVEDN